MANITPEDLAKVMMMTMMMVMMMKTLKNAFNVAPEDLAKVIMLMMINNDKGNNAHDDDDGQ